jgi:hypothetical protein
MTNHHAADLTREAQTATHWWQDERDCSEWWEAKAFELAGKCDGMIATIKRLDALLSDSHQ